MVGGMSMQQNLWLVEPSRLFRDGLKSLLAPTQFEVVAEATSLTALAECANSYDTPAIIVVSLQSSLARPSGEECALRALCSLWGRVPVVTLTAELSVPQLVAALKAGACGYLVKDLGAAALRESLALILLGEKVLPSELVPMLINAPAPRETAAGQSLSRQEERILQHLARGEPNKIIAQYLDITESAVKINVKVLLRKIGAPNRTVAAIWALNNLEIDRM